MNKKNKGVTLIELLVYAALLTVVLGLATNLLYQVINFKANQQIESSLQQNTLLAFNKMAADIKNSTNIVLPIDQNYNSSLSLETPAGQIVYQVQNGILTRNGIGLTDNNLTCETSLPNYGFRKLGKSIQVRLKVTANFKPFGQEQKVRDYQTTVALRN